MNEQLRFEDYYYFIITNAITMKYIVLFGLVYYPSPVWQTVLGMF